MQMCEVRQVPELQSEGTRHVLPVAQVGQVPPPQSMSVSPHCASLTPLVQLPTSHLPGPLELLGWMQWRLRQSVSTEHFWPCEQGWQFGPPQSRSVSSSPGPGSNCAF